MKKNAYISWTALVLISIMSASCSDNHDAPEMEPDSGSYITFAAPGLEYDGAGHTRARLAESFGEGGITSFMVWGYCVPYIINTETLNYESASGDWNTKSAMCAPNVFDNGMGGTTVNVSGGKTDYGTLKPWIVNNNDIDASYDYNYSFIAAANGVGGNSQGGFSMGRLSSSDHTPVLTFNMPFSGGNTGDALDRADIPDALVASTFDRTRLLGKVNLSFDHILTGIRFRVNNKTGRELVVTKLTFQGQFYRTATYNFATNRMITQTVPLETSSYSGTYTVFDGNQTVVNDGSALLGKTDENPEGNVLLLLPNPNSGAAEHPLGANKRIIVEYTVGGEPRNPFAIDILRLNYNPQPNTRHTANLTFVDDNIVLVFQADNQTNWENGSDNSIDIH